MTRAVAPHLRCRPHGRRWPATSVDPLILENSWLGLWGEFISGDSSHLLNPDARGSVAH